MRPIPKEFAWVDQETLLPRREAAKLVGLDWAAFALLHQQGRFGDSKNDRTKIRVGDLDGVNGFVAPKAKVAPQPQPQEEPWEPDPIIWQDLVRSDDAARKAKIADLVKKYPAAEKYIKENPLPPPPPKQGPASPRPIPTPRPKQPPPPPQPKPTPPQPKPKHKPTPSPSPKTKAFPEPVSPPSIRSPVTSTSTRERILLLLVILFGGCLLLVMNMQRLPASSKPIDQPIDNESDLMLAPTSVVSSPKPKKATHHHSHSRRPARTEIDRTRELNRREAARTTPGALLEKEARESEVNMEQLWVNMVVHHQPPPQ